MKKMTELRIQVIFFMLALVVALLACHLPGSDLWVDVDDKGDVYVEEDGRKTILVTVDTQNELPLQNEGKNDGGLAGTYVGEPPIPSKVQEAQQNPNFTNFAIAANNVTIIVKEDGTTYGEKKFIYSYTAVGENDEPVHVSSSWIITFEGTLQEPPYQLDAIFDYHFVSQERDDKATMAVVYDIQISGDILSGAPSKDDSEADENNLEMFVFEATKQ